MYLKIFFDTRVFDRMGSSNLIFEKFRKKIFFFKTLYGKTGNLFEINLIKLVLLGKNGKFNQKSKF